ncbi:MTAP family purine nucleoside phosphorylase [Dehalococcoidia bacterium]|nr:MTAP family purine nucleoside phosphorylase [Dehalococcoidia bacterium]
MGIPAVGSLQENIDPLDKVIPNRIIDNTNGISNTFFGNGLVAHVSMADPFCTVMSKKISDLIKSMELNHHTVKTLNIIEAPQFSTYAESHLHRKRGGDIIGMTIAPEAKLAREAKICYSSIAMTTDYDYWNRSQDPITFQIVVSNLHKNVSNVRYLIKNVSEIANLSDGTYPCRASLSDAMIKDRLELNSDLIHKLQPIVGKYIN